MHIIHSFQYVWLCRLRLLILVDQVLSFLSFQMQLLRRVRDLPHSPSMDRPERGTILIL